MMMITLAGSVHSALTHFALYGIAAILETETEEVPLLSFSDEPTPRARVHLRSVDETQVADAVQAVATRWAEKDSWTQTTLDYRDGKNTTARSPFSPRIKPPQDPHEWNRHQNHRWRFLDQLISSHDHLALDLLGGLGEPAYWRQENKSPRPDHGASRWEMKTRNQGQEFIRDRFALLCTELAAWSSEDILAGIMGTALNDTLSKNSPGSRTSTGLTTPGPTDVALAFCALVGLASLPVSHQTQQISITPAAYPTNVLHTRHMVLPVPAVPVTLERLRSVLLSQQLSEVSLALTVAGDAAEGREEGLGYEASATWLERRGIPALVVFQVLKTGSSSAPERQVLQGTVNAL